MQISLLPAFENPSREQIALRFGDHEWTYAELYERCVAQHVHLASHGVAPGDRVAVWTHARQETLIALVTNALFGYVTVPLNPGLGVRELEHVMRDASPKVVIDVHGASTPHLAPHLEVAPLGASAQATSFALTSVDDAPLLILYTSGTTGAPKGAVLSSRNVAANLDALAAAWHWTAADTIVHALPLFHVHGLVLGLYGALRRGGTLEWHAKFDPLRVALGLLGPSRVLFAVPTMFHRFAEVGRTEPRIAQGLKNARLLVSGSAALPMREHERIERLTGRRVIERYGLTETLINCSVRIDEAPSAGRVGRPLDGVELRLVDDARNVIEAHDDETLGEVAVRGPNVFRGYLNRADATRAVIDEEGWFYTGDLATRDARGSIRIVGRRATDLIKTAGYKVGAGEVEAALLEHHDVRECAVVAEPDVDLGERIVAYIVLREGAHSEEALLIEHVGALIAKHKRPRAVRFIDELPRNAMGKVVKAKLRLP